MGELNMQTIRSQARRLAWYTPSLNPFGKPVKTAKRAGTWPPESPIAPRDPDADLENQPPSSFEKISTEPPTQATNSQNLLDPISEAPTGAANDAEGTRRQVGDSSEETAVEPPSSSFTVSNQLKNTLFYSWINILLLAAPVGIAINYVPSASPWAVFFVNFLAIIPLAALLSYGTEEVALRVGETLGGLLNASFGNAVEVIVSIIALVKGEVLIVKTSLAGSILSNLLLVMGMCFFFGGLRRENQFFNETVATTAASLLSLAIASVIIPTAFENFALGSSDSESDNQKTARTAAISRGSSVILLVVYACYLYFQLGTHSAMFQEQGEKVPMRPSKKSKAAGSTLKVMAAAGGNLTAPGLSKPAGQEGLSRDGTHDDIMQRNAWDLQAAGEGDEGPQLHLLVAIATLLISTALVALCAECMVSSIGQITEGGGISAEFVGLILLPIVGNAAEHATAVTVACKDKMDLAIGVAVGSSMQIALFVMPLTVIVGWIIGNDNMNLNFDGFQVAVLFVSVLLVNYLISDGKSFWLEGVLLMSLYLIISVTAWFYPGTSLSE